MKKTYNYENGTIYISGLDKYDQEKFKKATEIFLKKVISGGKNVNSNSSWDFREKQILYW